MNFNITNSKTRTGILKLFFSNPDKRYYLRELERMLDISVGNIRRELLFLGKQGIFNLEKKGNLLYYFLNKKYPLYKELKSIIFKTIGIEGRLKQVLKEVKGIKSAFIFGSFAKDSQDGLSDIDIFILGNVNADALAVKIDKLEKEFQREINYIVVGESEFIKKKKNKDPFFINILGEKNIKLI